MVNLNDMNNWIYIKYYTSYNESMFLYGKIHPWCSHYTLNPKGSNKGALYHGVKVKQFIPYRICFTANVHRTLVTCCFMTKVSAFCQIGSLILYLKQEPSWILPWSIDWKRWLRQNECPHGVVIGSYDFKHNIHSKSS